MAHRTPVHVLSRDEGWAVVREGNDRATSIHPTQSEAAKAGREIARKNKTTFLLHAKDGRVRDRSDYGGRSSRPEEETEGPASAAGDDAGGTVNAATRTAGGTVGLASGVVGGAVEGIGAVAAGGRDGGEDSGPAHEREGTDDAEEAGGLAYEERYADYEVYDRDGQRLGNVETLFLDEDDRPEYIGVKMGLLGTRSTLIPWAAVTREDEEGGRLEVDVDKETAENGPAFEEDQEITPELEHEVHNHYGFGRTTGAGDRGAYYPNAADTGPVTGTSVAGAGPSSERGHEGESLREPGPGEEIRVQRSEEELVAGTTRREAGFLRVRKRVRIEHETVEVPVRREEVHVERVPLSGEATSGEATPREGAATEAEIGEEEIVVPVVEEEVVVSKRPVVKEEVRVRKDVVEDTEVLEEDVRREEIDVEDDTTRRLEGPA